MRLRSPNGVPGAVNGQTTPPGHPRALPDICLLALICAASVVVLLVASTWARCPDPSSPANAGGLPWRQRRAALERWIVRHPGDYRASLRLASVLIDEALERAHTAFADSHGEDWREEAANHRQHVIDMLYQSPQVAAAQAMAAAVTVHCPDPALRGRAWARLATLHLHLGDRPGQIACLRAALRELPCQEYRLALREAQRAWDLGH